MVILKGYTECKKCHLISSTAFLFYIYASGELDKDDTMLYEKRPTQVPVSEERKKKMLKDTKLEKCSN